LKDIEKRLTDDTGLTPKISTEVEFFLSGEKIQNDPRCLAVALAASKTQSIHVKEMHEEMGDRQYEMSISTISSPLIAAKETSILRDIIISSADKMGLEAIFSAKPYENQPGSGLHINVSLHDSTGNNIFQKPNKESEEESDTLLYSIGGLCKTMAESMIFLAPNEESYARFSAELNKDVPENKPLRAYNNAPINISWGGNNRTTAIRVPTSTLLPQQRHIEHRVAGVDTDPFMVIAAVLAGIHYGITNNIEPSPKL